MAVLSLKSSLNSSESNNVKREFKDHTAVYLSNQDKISISPHQEKNKIIFSVLRASDKYYLFKDNVWFHDWEVRISGRPVYAFARINEKSCMISVENSDSARYQFLLEIDCSVTRPARDLKCTYCWGNFRAGELVRVIEGNEYHENCAGELKYV